MCKTSIQKSIKYYWGKIRENKERYTIFHGLENYCFSQIDP